MLREEKRTDIDESSTAPENPHGLDDAKVCLALPPLS
jgi:hypothetical protein